MRFQDRILDCAENFRNFVFDVGGEASFMCYALVAVVGGRVDMDCQAVNFLSKLLHVNFNEISGRGCFHSNGFQPAHQRSIGNCIAALMPMLTQCLLPILLLVRVHIRRGRRFQNGYVLLATFSSYFQQPSDCFFANSKNTFCKMCVSVKQISGSA